MIISNAVLRFTISCRFGLGQCATICVTRYCTLRRLANQLIPIVAYVSDIRTKNETDLLLTMPLTGLMGSLHGKAGGESVCQTNVYVTKTHFY